MRSGVGSSPTVPTMKEFLIKSSAVEAFSFMVPDTFFHLGEIFNCGTLHISEVDDINAFYTYFKRGERYEE